MLPDNSFTSHIHMSTAVVFGEEPTLASDNWQLSSFLATYLVTGGPPLGSEPRTKPLGKRRCPKSVASVARKYKNPEVATSSLKGPAAVLHPRQMHKFS